MLSASDDAVAHFALGVALGRKGEGIYSAKVKLWLTHPVNAAVGLLKASVV
jgi:hypothetical protein